MQMAGEKETKFDMYRVRSYPIETFATSGMEIVSQGVSSHPCLFKIKVFPTGNILHNAVYGIRNCDAALFFFEVNLAKIEFIRIPVSSIVELQKVECVYSSS